MKKLGVIVITAMLLTALAVSGALAADKADWKVDGSWAYTITLPEFTDTFDSVPVKISAEQTGIINITATDSEKEAGKECITGGAVKSVWSNIKYKLPDGTVETPSAYLEGPMSLGDKFKKDPYNPGEELSFTAPLYYDTKEGKQQIVGYMTAAFSQTGENKFKGTVTLSKAPGGDPIARGTFEATKPSADWKVGGKWDYTIQMPEFTDTFDSVPVKISAEQTGIINITSADSKEEAGKESIAGGAVRFVRSNIKYILPDSTVETRSGYLAGPVDLGEKFKKDPYNPGEEISFTAPLYYDTHEGQQQIVGYMTASFSQTGENKFKGTVTLSKAPGGDPIARGTFESARSSDSNGCNAGFGALALLALAGLALRKRNEE